jgi:hypothetical protein
VVFKGLIAATAALGLAAAPAVAASAAPAPAPAVETVDGSQLDGSSWLIALLALVAVVGGILAATNDGDDAPNSP